MLWLMELQIKVMAEDPEGIEAEVVFELCPTGPQRAKFVSVSIEVALWRRWGAFVAELAGFPERVVAEARRQAEVGNKQWQQSQQWLA